MVYMYFEIHHMNSSVELPRLDHKSKERRVCGLIWWGAHSTLPHAFFYNTTNNIYINIILEIVIRWSCYNGYSGGGVADWKLL
jgi:hypothetical protein